MREKEEKKKAKAERKKKTEEKKKQAEEKKKQREEEKKRKAEEKGKQPAKKKRKTKAAPVQDEEDSVDPDDVQMVLNDSSEYSDEVPEEAIELPTMQTYPFAEKAPEVRDFVFTSSLKSIIYDSLARVISSLFFQNEREKE